METQNFASDKAVWKVDVRSTKLSIKITDNGSVCLAALERASIPRNSPVAQQRCSAVHAVELLLASVGCLDPNGALILPAFVEEQKLFLS